MPEFQEEELPDGVIARYVVAGEDASGILQPWREQIDSMERYATEGNHPGFLEALLALHLGVKATLGANLQILDEGRRREIIRQMDSN